MWFNCALSCLIGIMFYMQPPAACFLFCALFFHLKIRRQLKHLFIIIPVIVLSMVWYKAHLPHSADFDWTNNKLSVYKGEFRFQDDLLADGDLLTGTVVIQGRPVKVNYYLQSESETERPLPYFQRCRGEIELKRPLPNTNGLKFHYDEYLLRHDIHLTGLLKHYDNCSPVSMTPVERLEQYRMTLSDRMQQLPGSHMGYVSALTLGDLRYLSQQDLDQLKSLGIYHLYAISGSHVALLSVQLYYVLRRSYLPVVYSRLLIAVLIPCYLILTGFSPSVVRSGLFIMIFMLCRPLGLTLLDSLSAAFILLMAFDPLQIEDVGFQLSFFISFILVFTGPGVADRSPLHLFLMTSIVSQLASLPILVTQFNSFQWSGFFTNLIFVPFFTLFVFPACTLLMLSLMIIHSVPSIIVKVVSWCFSINHLLTDWSSQLKLPDYIIGELPPVIQGLLYGAVLLLIYCSRLEIKRMTAGLLVFVCLLYLLSLSMPHNDQVTFLDVGQGDCIIIESEGKVMVIDTGGRLRFKDEPWRTRQKAQQLSDFTLLPFLKERGYDHIDYLLLTHPDQDHFGETRHLLTLIPVHHLIIDPDAPGVEKYEQFRSLLKQTQVLDAGRLKQLVIGRAAVNFIVNDHAMDENASSIVTKVVLDHQKYLLMGDLPIEAEHMVPCVPIDILKIGHHGSKTSTSDELLDCVKPKVAVISAGRNNRFGHPHKEVLVRLTERHIKIFNTQQDGRVTFGEKTVLTAKNKHKKTGQ